MYQRILVPVDGSPTANAGVDEAVKLAMLTGGRLRLVHVLEVTLPFGTGFETYTGDVLGLCREAGMRIAAEAKLRAASSGVQADTFIPEPSGERVCDVVANQAELWKADLIVVGTHGRRGVRRFVIGSNAEQIARSAPVPVLLVRMPGAEAAVSAQAGAARTMPVSRSAAGPHGTRTAAPCSRPQRRSASASFAASSA